MQEGKVAVVRRWFDRLRNGDPSPESCHPDIEIRNWAEAPAPGPYHGHDGVRSWWSDIQDSFEQVRFELVDVVDAGGDRVVTVQRLVGRFRLTGIDLDHTWGSIVSVRDGKTPPRWATARRRGPRERPASPGPEGRPGAKAPAASPGSPA